MATTRAPEPRDKFDMTQSLETWQSFQSLAKWIVILSVILLAGMAIFLTGTEVSD